MEKSLFCLLMVCLFLGCAGRQQLGNPENLKKQTTYHQEAIKRYGENVDCRLNFNKTYALCIKNAIPSGSEVNRLKEFFVYDIRKNEILYETKIASAKVSWYTNTQLIITKQRGYISSPTDSGKIVYIFDVLSKKKIDFNQSK